MDKKKKKKTLFVSSAAKLLLCHYSTLSPSRSSSPPCHGNSILSCSICSAAHGEFALSRSHPRPHINRQAGRLYCTEKSHCYATYVMLPAAPSVCLFISLHLFFTCLSCLLGACSRSHANSFVKHCRGKKKSMRCFIEKTCSSLVKRQFYESSLGITKRSVSTVNGCWHKSLRRRWKKLCK